MSRGSGEPGAVRRGLRKGRRDARSDGESFSSSPPRLLVCQSCGGRGHPRTADEEPRKDAVSCPSPPGRWAAEVGQAPDPPRPDQVTRLRSAIRKRPNASGSTTLRPRPDCLPLTASGDGAQGNGRRKGGRRPRARPCVPAGGTFSGAAWRARLRASQAAPHSREEQAGVRGPRGNSSFSRLPRTQDQAPRCGTGVQCSSRSPHFCPPSPSGRLGGSLAGGSGAGPGQ